MNDYEYAETLKAIKTATQMEIEGKEFYRSASQNSSSELGKKLLRSLSEEEDYHRKKFDELYNEIRIKKAWPKTNVQTDGGSNLRTVFANALDKPAGTNTTKSELDAVQMAIDMEAKKPSTTTGTTAQRLNMTLKKSSMRHWRDRKESTS